MWSGEPTFGFSHPPQAAGVTFGELAAVFFRSGYLTAALRIHIGVTHGSLIVAVSLEETLHGGSLQFSGFAHAKDYGVGISSVKQGSFTSGSSQSYAGHSGSSQNRTCRPSVR